ncbi:MAG: hypothetical protein ACRDQI_11125 [Pseudonocardiaceae bacterium]
MTVTWSGTDERVAALSCRAGCRVDPALRRHHDRLLAVESDVDELLELIELAVTWGELSYGGVNVVPPGQWLEFAARHEWRDPDRAARIFSVATDIALRTGRRETPYPLTDEVATTS